MGYSATATGQVLFRAKRYDRIDPGGATRRHKTRSRRHGRKQRRHSHINEWVERVHFEKNILQSGRGQNSQEQRGCARAQAEYLGVPVDGAYRSEHYRY